MTDPAASPTRPAACRPGAAAFVVLAGGSGTRLGAEVNKVYLEAAGRPLISWSLAWADAVPEVGRVVLVHRPQDQHLAVRAIEAAGMAGRVELVHGGVTRHASEQAALDHLSWPIAAGSIDVVAVHDGARPLAGAPLLRRVIQAATEHGGAVPTVPDALAWPVDDAGDLVRRTGRLRRVQTPQAFRAQPLFDAYARALRGGAEGTDTSAALEGRDDVVVVSVRGSEENLKVTFVEDLERVERLLQPAAGPPS